MDYSKRTYFEVAIAALLIGLGLRSFVLAPVQIASDAMEPTVHAGEFLLAWHHWGQSVPGRGAIVVFHEPQSEEELGVLRVVGVPGDRVSIADGRLEVVPANSEAVPDSVSLARWNATVQWGPVEVSSGHIVLLPDNAQSTDPDSRSFGLLPVERIQGRPFVIWFSRAPDSRLRWERVRHWL